jgi:hypothetical protein
MLINRNNYEEYFLRYADNELSDVEKSAVLEFIKANKDLEVELTQILDTVITPDEIGLTDKSFLYKPIVFEEDLLLKLDNELNKEKLNELNKNLVNNPASQLEYNILLKTKLDAADVVVFPNKDLLYKKQKDNTLVLFFRYAAAAAVIGLLIFFGLKFTTTNTASKKDLVNTTKENILPEKQIKKTITNKKDSLRRINENVVSNGITAEKETLIKNNSSTINDANVKVNKNQNTVVTNLNTKRTTDNKITTNKTTSLNSTEFIAKQNKVENVENKTVKNINELQTSAVNNSLKEVSISNQTIQPLEDTYANAVAVSDADLNENKILFLNEETVKKSKAGGFFRKIKRFVERTANVKTGNSLQIAGFEIVGK